MLACGCLCLLLLNARAQSGRKVPGDQQPGEKPVVKIETREVVLPLIAYDANGKFVDDLKPSDVLVLEEGEARPVAALKREPANIVLILDLANEIGTFKNGPTERPIGNREEKPIWQRARDYKVVANPTTRDFAERFVNALSPSDQISIIQYAERAQVIQDWTGDRNRALDALRLKYRVGVKSSYLDALKLAAEKLETRKDGRRVIVIVSDGLDSASKTGRSKVMAALERSRASVFVVGWAEALKTEIELAMQWMSANDRPGSSTYKRLQELRNHLPQLDGAAVELRQLAETSGGELWLPATHEDLIRDYAKVVAEVGAQYSLSFVTENKPSLEDNRSIQVLPARRGLSVRSRRSYRVDDTALDRKVK